MEGTNNMRITKYRTELDENRHNILVKEKAFNYQCNNLTSPDIIVELLNDCFHLNKMAEEYLYMIALDTKCHPLGIFEISHGTVNLSLVTPREIFIRAILCGATYIILSHNHPSGVVTPSKEDREIYKRIKESGKLIGIELLDNIIIGDGYYSFLEHEE